MNANEDFYKNLKPFHDFSEVTVSSNYVDVPDDWWVFLTDVRGSTEAITQGRYREVNMLGASSIAAVLNSVGNIDIPFIFGGDGATLAVPPSRYEQTVEALKKVQKLSDSFYKMHLRVGCIQVKEIKKQGQMFKTAKYELSAGNQLAQFSGGGATLAEKLIKNKSHGAVLIEPDENTSAPDLKGLSCRWSPFNNRKGVILSLLIKPKVSSDTENILIKEAVTSIELILGNKLKDASPITLQNMRAHWPPKTLMLEAASEENFFKRVRKYLSLLLLTFVVHIVIKLKLSLGDFVAKKYTLEMTTNSDFKKFDDVLRMVIDCSEPQALEIEKYLEDIHQKGKLIYGSHRSKSAVMTCLVFSMAQGRHIHFIDGADGGYAMAATQLKKQM